MATGEIQISSSDTLFEPFVRCLLAFTPKGTAGYDKAAISLSGSGLNVHGIIYSPNGGIDVSGANNSVLVGSLIGRGVKVVGANFQLAGVNLESCQPASTPISAAKLAQLDRGGFLQASVEGQMLTLSFGTERIHTYTLESSQSVVSPDWTTIATFTGDGSPQSLVTPSSVAQRFYRLRIGQTDATPQQR